MERERPLRLSQQIKMSVDFRWNNFSVYEREERGSVVESKAHIQNYYVSNSNMRWGGGSELYILLERDYTKK